MVPSFDLVLPFLDETAYGDQKLTCEFFELSVVGYGSISSSVAYLLTRKRTSCRTAENNRNFSKKKLLYWWAIIYNVVYAVVYAFTTRIRDRIVSLTNATSDSKILDVATGAGKQAFTFARRGYNVVGIDSSARVLKEAEEVKEKNCCENVHFEIADAARMPFEDDRFDVSCISFALHEMPPLIRKTVIEEMRRVTKPNGMIIIADFLLPKNRFFRRVFCHYIKLCKSEYYPEFVLSELEASLKSMGIEVKESASLAMGIGKILKGVNQKNSPSSSCHWLSPS